MVQIFEFSIFQNFLNLMSLQQLSELLESHNLELSLSNGSPESFTIDLRNFLHNNFFEFFGEPSHLAFIFFDLVFIGHNSKRPDLCHTSRALQTLQQRLNLQMQCCQFSLTEIIDIPQISQNLSFGFPVPERRELRVRIAFARCEGSLRRFEQGCLG